jgi:aminoglycoside 3-N-acetyltransferase
VDWGTGAGRLACARVPGLALTREALVADLRALGVRLGQTLLVHASLSAVGWVDGGPATVVEALHDSVGNAGTVVMPAITPENSTTSRVYRERTAGLSPRQVAEYHALMPPFDRLLTPAIKAGIIAETLRTMPGAVRSDHPQSSFAAMGEHAASLMAGHQLTSHFGEESPLAGLYDLPDAAILLLGVGYEACSALHLAEYRYAISPPTQVYRCVVSVNGNRRWVRYRDVVLDDEDFRIIGRHAEKRIEGALGNVGGAECHLMPLRDVVDFATGWMARHRS